jgi:8-oxo-dGTP pyrophosphatase MutT (NUDIX family)
MATSFNPRLADLLGYDAHLPAVQAERLLPSALAERFKQPPIWQPDVDIERWLKAPNPVAASVLIPLVMRPSPTVLLTQRTAHLNKHAGQISFPGGRREDSDPSAVFTALREAEEEVGLDPERVTVLGCLPTYTTGTGFVVTPVVGLIHVGPHEGDRLDLKADPSEVESIFEVPLSFLMDPRHHQRRVFAPLATGDDGETKALEFFAMDWQPAGRSGLDLSVSAGHFIWGATAAMLRNLYRMLSA